MANGDKDILTVEFKAPASATIASMLLMNRLPNQIVDERTLEIDVTDRVAVSLTTEWLRMTWFVCSFFQRWHVEFEGAEEEAKNRFMKLVRATVDRPCVLLHGNIAMAKGKNGKIEWRPDVPGSLER